MGARYSRNTGYTVARRVHSTRPTVRTVQRRVRFGPTAAKYFGLAVLAVLAIVMLTQSSTNATTAYKQNDLRKQASDTNAAIQQLQLEADRAKSLQSIQSAPIKDQMQPMGSDTGVVAGVSTQQP